MVCLLLMISMKPTFLREGEDFDELGVDLVQRVGHELI
jgi:hypothetical protein